MELHEKYAPILCFNKGERFFPMRVDDMLSYCSLRAKGGDEPIVRRGQLTPDLLARRGQTHTTYLRSVVRGPRKGEEVVEGWGKGALEMVVRWSAAGPVSLADRLARKAYSWLSPKTAHAASLFWWNGLVRHVLEGELGSSPPDELPRLVLPTESQRSAIEQFTGSSPPPTYYYRQLKDGNYLCLQYWFFYSYNDWGRGFGGMNDHEGDWEGMMVFFRLGRAGRPQEPPAYVTFADHESRQTKPWGHEDVTIQGTHPLGFIAAGSHATYPECKTHPLMKLYSLYDYATGDGRVIDHSDWVYRINLDTARWLKEYRGSWGTRFWLPMDKTRSLLKMMMSASPLTTLMRLEAPDEIELPGVSAPRGPMGPHRPQYAKPVEWAGIPD